MASMELRLTQAERGLGLQWVAANVVGWLIGFVACEAIQDFVATVFVDGLVIGAALGIAQGLVLRRRIAPLRWWLLASLVGFGAGKAIGEALIQGSPTFVSLGLTGAALGASVGIAQWLILRRHVHRAGWWLLANIAGWTLGWSVIGSVDDSAGLPPLALYGVGATGAAIAGMITGIALIRLSRSRLA